MPQDTTLRTPRGLKFTPPPAELRRSLGRIFHFNLNVNNLEETLKFYSMFGFQEVQGFASPATPTPDGDMHNIYGDHVVGATGDKSKTTLHFRHIRLGNDPTATRIDVVEWVDPKPHGKPMNDLTQTGVARISLFLDNNYTGDRSNLQELNIFKWYRRLQAANVRFYNPEANGPVEFGELSETWILPFYDPNGIVLQLLQGNM